MDAIDRILAELRDGLEAARQSGGAPGDLPDGTGSREETPR